MKHSSNFHIFESSYFLISRSKALSNVEWSCFIFNFLGEKKIEQLFVISRDAFPNVFLILFLFFSWASMDGKEYSAKTFQKILDIKKPPEQWATFTGYTTSFATLPSRLTQNQQYLCSILDSRKNSTRILTLISNFPYYF